MPTSETGEGAALQDRLEALGREILSGGLPLNEDRITLLALARLLRDRLTDRDNPERVLDAAKLATAVFEESLERNPPGNALDCKMGCSYCCHRIVGVSAPEAFLAAHEVTAGSSAFLGTDALRLRAEKTIGRDADARYDTRVPCFLLEQDACAIYTARPLACRANASHSVDACRRNFEGEAAGIPAPRVHLFLGDRCRLAMYTALRSLGLPAVSYEFSEAVTRIMGLPEAMRLWLDGEDVLDGVQAPPDRDRELDDTITEMARLIEY